jgi:hypothetical protein
MPRLAPLPRPVQNQEELAETQERLDFAERLLAKGRGRRRWKDYLFRLEEASENTCLAQVTTDCG